MNKFALPVIVAGLAIMFVSTPTVLAQEMMSMEMMSNEMPSFILTIACTVYGDTTDDIISLVFGLDGSDCTISTEHVEVMEHDPPTIVTMIEGSLLPDCQVTDDCFDPNTVTVSSGDTVTWVNEDSLIHTVTALNPHPDGVLDSFVNPGDQFEFTFDTPGEYPYHCVLHPWAVGKVIVESSESIDGENRHAEVMDEIIAQYDVRGDAIIKYINESVGSLYTDVSVFVVDKESLTLVAHSTAPQYIGIDANAVLNQAAIPAEYIIELLQTQTDGVWISYPVPDPTDPTNVLFYDRGWFKDSGDYYFAVRTSLTNESTVQNVVNELVRVHELYPSDTINNINTRTTGDPQYPFILSPADYTVLAHGANPDRVGSTSIALTDADRPVDEIIADLQNNDGTWVEYTFAHPTTGMDQSKRSWLVLYDDLIFGAGYYIDDNSMTSP